MSSLTYKEQVKLENLFEMGNGLVLRFSDKSLRDFIISEIGIDIQDEKYNYKSGSKANRIRGFWKVESDINVARLCDNLLDFWYDQVNGGQRMLKEGEEYLYEEGKKIVERLKSGTPVENIDAITANNDEQDFNVLAKKIREDIEQNHPEAALDRLHTFGTRYFRELCDKHGYPYDKNTPLQNLVGGYVKVVSGNGTVESEASKRILKNSISILDALNDVRNNKSFAHANKILNYDESLLIFQNVSTTISFIEKIESPKREVAIPLDKEDDLGDGDWTFFKKN